VTVYSNILLIITLSSVANIDENKREENIE